jgi:hypothetical protein
MNLRVIILTVGTILLNPMTESSAQTNRAEWKSRSGESHPSERRYQGKFRRRVALNADRNDSGPRHPIASASETAKPDRIRLISLRASEDTNHAGAGDTESPHASEESGSVLPQPLPPVSARAAASEEEDHSTGHAAQHSGPTGNVTIFSDQNRRNRTLSSPPTSEEMPKSSAKHGTDDDHISADGAHDPQQRTPGRDSSGKSLKQSFVIDGPIDRLGLADNLYLTGELVLALEMYEQIEASAESPDEIFWVRYQAACCLRRLGSTDEAQAGYRRIAEAPEAGWLHELSIWWLDRINERLVLEADLQKLKQLTQDLRENNHVNSSH